MESSFSLHFLILLSVLLQLFEIGESENTLKVCGKEGQVFQISAESCGRGVWVREALNVECVCGSGLWILSENFCDKDFHLIAIREDECFQIKGKVRRFISLLDVKDLILKKAFWFHENLGDFQEFEGRLRFSAKFPKNLNGSPFLILFNNTDKFVFASNGDEGKEGSSKKGFWQRCFEPLKKRRSDVFQLIKLGENASFFKTTEAVNCKGLSNPKFKLEKTKGFVSTLELGQSWHSMKAGFYAPSAACKAKCFNKTVRIVRSVKPKKFALNSSSTKVSKSTAVSPENDDYDESSELSPEERDEIYDLSLQNEENSDSNFTSISTIYGNDKDVLQERLQDNGRDTLKMANHLKKWMFYGISGPKVLQKEFRYFQLSRIIFLKSCPDIDGNVVTNFFRMFRFLLYEVLKKRPELYPENTEEVVHEEILSSLRNCYKRGNNYFSVRVEEGCPREGEDESQLAIKVLNITDSKGKAFSPFINSTEEEDVPFKLGRQSDTVLETVWKLMLHAHYYCAEDFKNHPEHLSWMYVKLQEFLTNPYVMFRWENPGDYLNKVYTFLLPGFKLVKYAKIMDACVSAAKESSVYEDWLQRPRTPGKHVKSKAEIRVEAVNSSNRSAAATTPRPTSTATTQKQRQSPFNRISIKATMFAGKGYCVTNFEDPINWTKISPEIDAKC